MTLFSWSTPPAEAGVEGILGSSLATVLAWIVGGRTARRAATPGAIHDAVRDVRPAPGAASPARTPNVVLGPTVYHPPGAVRLTTPEEEAAFR